MSAVSFTSLAMGPEDLVGIQDRLLWRHAERWSWVLNGAQGSKGGMASRVSHLQLSFWGLLKTQV